MTMLDVSGAQIGSVLLDDLVNVQQEASTNCWAGVVAALGRYFDVPLSQWSIHAASGIDYGKGGSTLSIERAVRALCGADFVELSDISVQGIGRELAAGRPLVLFVASDTPDVGHVVLVRGLIFSGVGGKTFVVVNDPSFADDVSLLVDFAKLSRSIDMAWSVRK